LNTRVHRYRGERAEGERAEAEMDAHIRRASKHRAEYERLAQEKIDTVSANLEKTRAAAFKPRVGTDSHTQVQMSMRDALDRLEGVTDPRELRSRLVQSHELGDSIQAKANPIQIRLDAMSR
jgi:hypothetical protein